MATTYHPPTPVKRDQDVFPDDFDLDDPLFDEDNNGAMPLGEYADLPMFASLDTNVSPADNQPSVSAAPTAQSPSVQNLHVPDLSASPQQALHNTNREEATRSWLRDVAAARSPSSPSADPVDADLAALPDYNPSR